MSLERLACAGSLLASGAGMDASAALSELLGLSTQVVEAVITGPDGTVEASHTASETRARELSARRCERSCRTPPRSAAGRRSQRVHVDLERGSLVVVRDAGRTIVATNRAASRQRAWSRYDLRTALRRAARGAGVKGSWCCLRSRSARGSCCGAANVTNGRVVVVWEDGSEVELGRRLAANASRSSRSRARRVP